MRWDSTLLWISAIANLSAALWLWHRCNKIWQELIVALSSREELRNELRDKTELLRLAQGYIEKEIRLRMDLQLRYDELLNTPEVDFSLVTLKEVNEL